MKSLHAVSLLLFVLFSGKETMSQCTNVALGKPTTATGTYLSNIPANAFDGNCGAYWNSGGYAPQSIQVDLQGTYTINNINLIVAMLPNGNCTHTIYTAPNIGGPWTSADVISGFRFSGEKIERCYSAAPLAGVGAVKVESTASPSWIAWVEIGIFTLSPPASNPTITPSGSLTICQGSSVTLTASAGSSYLWSPGGETTQSIVVNTSGNYCVTLGTGCITGTASCTACGGGNACATVTVTSSPLPTISGISSLCAGDTTTLTASGGTTYLWNTGATTTSITINPSINTTYSVTASAGSCSEDTSITITVNPLPSPVIFGISSLCAGNTTTLTASGGTTYLWNTGATTTSITVNPSTNTTYSVTASAGSCSGDTNITVIVSPAPIAVAENNQTVCAGLAVVLNADGGNNYSWSPSTGLSNPNISNPMASPVATTTYTVTVSNGVCTDIASVTVFVNPLPVADAGIDITITVGDNVPLAATGGGTYSWSPTTGLSCATCANPTVTPANGGTGGLYCVTVTDANNCTDTACVTVTVIAEQADCSNAGEIYLPNAFSPNNDGENDALKIYYGNINCIREFHLVIYNRWGEKVFETTTPTAQWDGSYRRKTEGTAVFVYYLNAALISEEEIIKKGNISLIK